LLKIVYEVIKIVFKKISRKAELRRRGIPGCIGSINGVEQKIEQRNDQRKLKNAEKRCCYGKERKRENKLS
jgi:hypothetical protein